MQEGIKPLKSDVLDFDEVMENYKKVLHEVARVYNDTMNIIHFMHEEFGFPRDSFEFIQGTPVTARDAYYSHIFNKIVKSKKNGGRLIGANFWGWGGTATQNPDHIYWKEGDDYCGDPSQEQQGLNSVYISDTTTTSLIKKINEELRK